MCPFVETIRIVDGHICRLPLHQARLARTLAHFVQLQGGECGDVRQVVGEAEVTLSSVLDLATCLADRPQTGVVKARVVYDLRGIVAVEYHPYTLRPINSLRLVTDDTIDYSYKYTDRSRLAALQAQRGNCDEVLIVRRGLITDTSYTNVAFCDGTSWYTPRTPLLAGTMRRYLLDQGIVQERDIHVEDLPHYSQVALFNAMIEWGEVVVDAEQIVG